MTEYEHISIYNDEITALAFDLIYTQLLMCPSKLNLVINPSPAVTNTHLFSTSSKLKTTRFEDCLNSHDQITGIINSLFSSLLLRSGQCKYYIIVIRAPHCTCSLHTIMHYLQNPPFVFFAVLSHIINLFIRSLFRFWNNIAHIPIVLQPTHISMGALLYVPTSDF